MKDYFLKNKSKKDLVKMAMFLNVERCEKMPVDKLKSKLKNFTYSKLKESFNS